MSRKPDEIPTWLQQEDTRAKAQVQTGEMVNPHASQIVSIGSQSKPKKPAKSAFVERSVKGLRIRKDLQAAFDTLVLQEKLRGEGKTGPELADEAIELLCKKYKLDLGAFAR